MDLVKMIIIISSASSSFSLVRKTKVSAVKDICQFYKYACRHLPP